MLRVTFQKSTIMGDEGSSTRYMTGSTTIILNFDYDALEDLRAEVTKRESGIRVADFVSIMCERLPHLYDYDKVGLVASLTDLFEEIDVNGDGYMEWDEFTGYCVELGFVATRRQLKPLKYKYIYDEKFTDIWSKGPCIHQIRYVEELRLLLVVETGASVIKIFDEHCNFKHEFNPPSTFTASLPEGQQKERNNIGAAVIRHVEYIPDKHWLVVCTSDQRITFYDAPGLGQGIYQRRSVIHCNSQQLKAHWSTLAGTLFTSDKNGALVYWDMDKKEEIQHNGPKHKSVVTSMLEIPMHKALVTAGLDCKVYLWELTKMKINFKGDLKDLHQILPMLCAPHITHHIRHTIRTGHHRAVKDMAFSAQNDILITVSFEYEAIGWDLATRCSMLRLKGHRSSLVGVEIVNISGHERAFTADTKGTFKLWEIRRSLTGMATCVQSFDVSMAPVALAAIPSTRNVITASNKLHILRCMKQRVQQHMPVCAIYNPVSMTILTASGTNVQIYDAETGKQCNEFYDVSKHDITSVCLDDRKRKFIIGDTNGVVSVHNYLNGAPMKFASQRHLKDIAAMVYNDKDKCLITAAWDKCVRVYDEKPREEVAVLRTIHRAHARDISCMAFSHRLSLIATGSSDFTVNLFDFQFAKRVAVLHGHTSEVTCMIFAEPYGILISGDSTGNIIFWAVRPSYYEQLAVLRNDQELLYPDVKEPEEGAEHEGGTGGQNAPAPTATEAPTSPSSTGAGASEGTFNLTQVAEPVKGPNVGTTGVHVLGVRQCNDSAYHLYTGDYHGIMRCWDLSEFLGEFEPPPDSRLTSCTAGYNPYRRVDQKGEDTASGVTVGSPYKPGKAQKRANESTLSRKHSTVLARPATAREEDLFKLKYVWQAHTDAIKSLQVIDEPLSLLTSSQDMSVRLWSTTGAELGILVYPPSLKKQMMKNGVKWHFKIDRSSRVEGKKLKAARMLAELQAIDEHASEKIRQERIQEQAQEEWVKRQEAKEAKDRLLEAQRKGIPLKGPAAKKPDKKAEAKSKHRAQILKQLVSKEKKEEEKKSTVVKLNKSVPKVFQRLNSVPVNSYKHFLSEARRRKISSSSEKQLDLRTSPFLKEQLQMQRELQEKRHVERAITAPAGQRKPRNRYPKPEYKGKEYERLKQKLAKAHLESPYNELRNRGLMSPWEKRSEELLQHFERLAKSDTPQSLITALPKITNRSIPKLYDDRIQNTLKRFETLTSPAKRDPRLSFEEVKTSELFFGPFDYDETLKFTRMVQSLERNRREDFNGQFDYNLTYGQEEWRDHPIRQLIAKLNQSKSVPHWIETVQTYHEKRSLGQTQRNAAPASTPIERQRPNKKPRRFGVYTAKEVLDLKILFDSMDTDGNASINLQEFLTHPKWQSNHLSTTASSVFNTVDHNRDGAITLWELLAVAFPAANKRNLKDMEEFLQIASDPKPVKNVRERKLSDQEIKEISEMFKVFDLDGNGQISLKEIVQTMGGESSVLGENDLAMLAEKFDKDGDQMLDLEEFKQLMKDQYLNRRSKYY